MPPVEALRGHRARDHTADVVVEAWGETRADCLSEAVLGLVSVFADTTGAVVTEPMPITAGPADDEELLILILEEVIYVAEVLGRIPVTVELSETEEGGIAGWAEAARADDVEIIGAVPKGVSRHGLRIAPSNGIWRCEVTVDV